MTACNPLLEQRERASRDARAWAKQRQENNSLRSEKDRYETDIPQKSLYLFVRPAIGSPSLSQRTGIASILNGW
jgi:hypothetical protein